jgi:hydroxymethylpyrimidine pyrophosphatase-like HAD family hydrolase
MDTNHELLEFFAPKASKSFGAKTLAEKLSVNQNETLAFGDGNNDVEILGWAGCSVAMQHGRESARKAAKFVSGDGSPDTAFARAVDMVLA